jgi:hypothetical protein
MSTVTWVTAVAAPFVRPTIAKGPPLCLKAAGLCLVLTGLGVRILGMFRMIAALRGAK